MRLKSLRPTLRSWFAAAAVAALLAAQAFGLAHRIEHDVGHRPAGHAHHDHEAHAVGAAVHVHSDVPSHEEGSATCRLVDQVGHADAAPASAAPALPPVATPSAPPPCGVRAVAKSQAHPYRARGPPSVLA